MMDDLFILNVNEALIVVFSTVMIFVGVITYTRIAGLRSFSKMSSFDFAMTVAVGSLIASVSVAQVSLVKGVVALGVLYLLQVVIALLRRRAAFKRLVDNTPVLLVANGQLLREPMRRERVTEADIMSKIREANISNLDGVTAVILETTGDISVMTNSEPIDEALLHGVRGADVLN